MPRKPAASRSATSSRTAAAKPATKRVRAPAKRTYLSRDLRRQTLLEVAAGIVERDGWSALTMSALAEQGGTSRQLVYLHFPNLEDLLAATARLIFMDTMRETQASLMAHPRDLVAAVKAAEAVSLDLNPGRGDALWHLLAGTAAASPELEKIRRQLRTMIVGVWAEPLAATLNLKPKEAQAYAWMLVMAFWGMRQLIRDQKMPRAQGIELYGSLIERVLTSR